MAISAKSTTAIAENTTIQKRRRLLLPLRLRKNGVINATDTELESAQECCEQFAILSTGMVFIGLVLEVYIAIKHPSSESYLERWGSVVADILVALGVLGELLPSMLVRRYSAEVGKRSAEKLTRAIRQSGEANERASKADLARVELENKLRARSISKEQFEILEKLKGQISEIRIASDTDAEPMWFAQLLAAVLLNMGITVNLLPRAPGFKSSVNILCDKRAFSNPDGAPTNGEPLASIFNGAGIPVAILGGYPMDLRGEWGDDVPMIVIGSSVLSPEPAYLGPGLASARVL
jgi:hypothetical protein